MKFRAIDANVSPLHLVDDDSGIEFFEKNGPERVRRWIEEGEDSRRRGVTFVFRDTRWVTSDGGHNVEFRAIGRPRILETKDSQTSKIFRTEVIYGFDIRGEEFYRSFAEYTGGDQAKIAQVRDFARAAILFYLSPVPGTIVNFT
jgi:hypothetical protein